MVGKVEKYQVWLIKLDPSQGSEIRKTRPCAIVSPNQINRSLRTVTVVPLTTKGKPYPWRVPLEFDGKKGFLVTDQIRVADKSRMLKYLGDLDAQTAHNLSEMLQEIFEE